MRYNTAVINLLQRVSENPHELQNKLSRRFLSSFTANLYLQCERLSGGWAHEDGGNKRPYESLSTTPWQPRAETKRWGSMAEHVPALALLLELSRLQSNSFTDASRHDTLVRRILYSVPRRGSSIEVYGLLRALTLMLIPEDLNGVTTARLIACFAILTAIKASQNEVRRGTKHPWELREGSKQQTLRRNREVGAALARLPPRVVERLVIADDAQLLRRLAEEFVRRLPPAGQTLNGDYLKTLIEGTKDANGYWINPSFAYTFHNVQWNSSTTAVTREEAIMMLPKLVVAEGRVVREYRLQLLEADLSVNILSSEWARPAMFSPATVAVVANAVSHLCLVTQAHEVAAARDICFSEWFFLISMATATEESWSAPALSALCAALDVVESQRQARVVEAMRAGRQASAADASLFPFEEGSSRWLFRIYASGLYSIRHDAARLERILCFTKPLLYEYVRQLRNAEAKEVETLFGELGGLQALWSLLRVFGLLNCQAPWSMTVADRQRISTQHVDGDDDDDSSSNSSSNSASASKSPLSPHDFTEQEKIALLAAIVEAGGPTLGTLHDAGSIAAAPNASVPLDAAAPPGSDAIAKEKPGRGAGFARTALPLSQQEAKVGASSLRPAAAGVPPTLNADALHLFLHFKLIHCVRVLQHRGLTEQEYRAAVATSLTTLAERNALFPALVDPRFAEKIRPNGLHLRRSADSPHPELETLVGFLSQEAMDSVFLLWQVLLPSNGHTLLPEERRKALLQAVGVVEQAMSVVQLTEKVGTVDFRFSTLMTRLSEFFRFVSAPSAAAEDGAEDSSNAFDALRRAVRRLCTATFEVLHKIRLPTHTSRPPPRWGKAIRHALPFQSGRSPHITTVRLTDSAMMMGADAGLTSGELPHLASTAHYVMDLLADLGGIVTKALAADWEGTTNTVEAIQMLHSLGKVTVHFCAMGVTDDATLTAVGKAVRACTSEAIIRSTRPSRRCSFMVQAMNVIRALGPRHSTSRPTRSLLKQLFVAAERLTVERLAFDGVVVWNGGRERLSVEGNIVMGLLMWQMSCEALGFSGSSATVERCARSFHLFARRYLVVPVYPGYAPPASPTSLEHMELCERLIHHAGTTMMGYLKLEAPQTPQEVLLTSNTLFVTVDESARIIYSRLFQELGNTSSAGQRQAWAAHMETYTALLDRFQDVLAPTAWYRSLRQCWRVHSIANATHTPVPTIVGALVRALERVLLHTKAHNNVGQWAKTGARENDDKLLAGPNHAVLLDDGKLLTYHTAARFLVFQDAIPNMALRVYLVELVDGLVQEHKDDVFDPNLLSVSRTRNYFGENEVRTASNMMLRSGRLSISSAYRKMAL